MKLFKKIYIYYKIKRNLEQLTIEDIQKYFKKLFNWNSFVGKQDINY